MELLPLAGLVLVVAVAAIFHLAVTRNHEDRIYELEKQIAALEKKRGGLDWNPNYETWGAGEN